VISTITVESLICTDHIFETHSTIVTGKIQTLAHAKIIVTAYFWKARHWLVVYNLGLLIFTSTTKNTAVKLIVVCEKIKRCSCGFREQLLNMLD